MSITPMRDIHLLDGALDPAALLTGFTRANPDAGGLCSFTGQVRGKAAGDTNVEALELSHYEPLTLAGMEELASEVSEQFDLTGLLLVHRIGTLHPGDPIVFVAAASVHRRDAFLAADYAMDHLKSAAWFWKREKRKDGWHWIEPRAADHSDRKRWMTA
jgi:molybdopterin synthase catalytic subunit